VALSKAANVTCLSDCLSVSLSHAPVGQKQYILQLRLLQKIPCWKLNRQVNVAVLPPEPKGPIVGCRDGVLGEGLAGS